VLETVAQFEQMDRVLRRVVQHPLRQRRVDQSARWCFLSSFTPKVARAAPPGQMREGRAVGPRRAYQRCCGRASVVLLQQPEIVVSVVKDDLDRWVLEDPAEPGGMPDGYRIDDCRSVAA
jgi:hypothetical protein